MGEIEKKVRQFAQGGQLIVTLSNGSIDLLEIADYISKIEAENHSLRLQAKLRLPPKADCGKCLELENSLSLAQQNANRYRWLRGDTGHNGFHMNDDLHIGDFEVKQKVDSGVAMYWFGEKLDKAIDDEMKKSGST